MKTSNINSYILMIFTLLLITSCEKVLDKYPLDQITSETYWKTPTDLQLYANQFYPNAFVVATSDRWQDQYPEDIQSDNMTYVDAHERLRGSRTIPATEGWSYSNIRSTNIFLKNYTKCEGPIESYQKYVGEVYFFRAFFYFGLVKQYGNVPYYTKELGTASEELYMARTPRNQVIDSIIADLNLAIQYLPSGRQEGGTRLSKEIALLFKSRVCLYEGTWEKYHQGSAFGVSNPNPQKYFQMAIEAVDPIMSSGIYTINKSGKIISDYFDQFGSEDYTNHPEVMFYKAFALELDMSHNRESQTGRGQSGGVGLTKSFVDSYLCTDGKPIFLNNGAQNSLYLGDDRLNTIVANRDPRLEQTIVVPGAPLQIYGTDTIFFIRPAIDQPSHLCNPTGFQMKKFLNYNQNYVAAGGGGKTDIIFFRYAEVLLNYAEAKAELGTITQGDIDKTIKLLRDRVGMPNLVISAIERDPNWKYPTLSPVINEIRRERCIELIGEGFGWDDIARWAAADEVIVGKRPMGAKFQYDYADLNPANFNLTNGYLDPLGTQIPNGYGFKLGRDYLTAIPTQELVLNPNLVQNPGWAQ